jgi:hypothetical protein
MEIGITTLRAAGAQGPSRPLQPRDADRDINRIDSKAR